MVSGSVDTGFHEVSENIWFVQRRTSKSGGMVRLGGFGGSGGSVWVLGEWSVGQWIVGVISF